MDIHALGLGPAPPPAPPPAPQSPDAIPFGFPGYGGVPHPLVPTRTGRQQPFFKGQARNSKDGSPFVAGGGVGAVGGRGGRPTPVKRAGALANATRLVRGPAASTPATELEYVVSPSCSACRKAKKGCPGGSPCSRCDKLGAKCVYLTKAIRKGRLSGESVNAAVDETVIADANAVEVAVAGAVDGSVQVATGSVDDALAAAVAEAIEDVVPTESPISATTTELVTAGDDEHIAAPVDTLPTVLSDSVPSESDPLTAVDSPMDAAAQVDESVASESVGSVDPNPPFPSVESAWFVSNPQSLPSSTAGSSSASLGALDVLADAVINSPPHSNTPLVDGSGSTAPTTNGGSAGGAQGGSTSNTTTSTGKTKAKKTSSTSSAGGGGGGGGTGGDGDKKPHHNRQARTLRDPACTACRSLKKKCPGGTPCAPCNRAGRECIYKCGIPARSRKRKGESATVLNGGVGGVKTEFGGGASGGSSAQANGAIVTPAEYPSDDGHAHSELAVVADRADAKVEEQSPGEDYRGSSDDGEYELEEDTQVYDPELMAQGASSSSLSDGHHHPHPHPHPHPAHPTAVYAHGHTPLSAAGYASIPPVPIAGPYGSTYPPYGSTPYGYHHPIGLPSASHLYQPSPSNVRSD